MPRPTLPSSFVPAGDGDPEDPSSDSSSSDSDSIDSTEHELYVPTEHYTDSDEENTDDVPGKALVVYSDSDEEEAAEPWWGSEPVSSVDDSVEPGPGTSTAASGVESGQAGPPEVPVSAASTDSSVSGSSQSSVAPSPLWAPSDGWEEVPKGRLWCPASGTVVRTRSMSRHVTGRHDRAPACPLGQGCPLAVAHGAVLKSFQKNNADSERTCPCGTVIKSSKRGINAAISKHVHQAKAHAQLTPDQRHSLALDIRNQAWRTATAGPSPASGLPVLGERVSTLGLAPPGTSKSTQKLSLSIAAVGDICKHWDPDSILSKKPGYVQAVRRLLAAAHVAAPDFRYVLGSVAAMDAVRRVLNHELETRPPTGKLYASALLTLTVYLRGRLAFVPDDLSHEWTVALDMFADMVRVTLKDTTYAAAAHDARRATKRQEQPMDVSTEFRERSELMEKAQTWMRQFMANPSVQPDDVVQYRQVLFLTMSVLAGHRTGVWQGLTLDEFQDRHHLPDGAADIWYVGGKNIRRMGGTTVALDKDTECALTFFVGMLRRHLRTAKGSDRLLPGLDVYHQGQHASRALGVPPKKNSRDDGGKQL